MSISFKTRQYVLQRDKRCCVYCQCGLHTGSINIDHLIPISRGGNSRRENLAASCERCNRRKADLLPLEFVTLYI